MADDERRSGSVPHPKATSLFARTVYRELRRAGYEQQDLVRFVADLTETITENLRKVDPEIDRHLAGVVDAETGLPNRGTFHEIAEFEIRTARESRGSSLLLVCLEVMVPEWCPDDLAHAIHVRMATALRSRVRPEDMVARVAPNRYAALLRGAGEEVVHALSARLGAVLGAERREGDRDAMRSGATYALRAVPWSPDLATSDALLDACLARGPRPIALGVAPPPSRAQAGPSSAAPAVAPRRATLSVVLALGGGAVRAAAHVGVVALLREAGVDIAGIAGTSAGALVGAMLLSGMTDEEVVARLESFASTPLYKQMRRLYAAYSVRTKRNVRAEKYFRQSGLAFLSDTELGAIPDDLFAAFVEYFVGADRDIGTLSRPFAATAMDVVEGRPAVFSRGPLHQALRASCAVPGLFLPQRDGPRLLIDGATTSEVPVAAALALRCNAPTLAIQ